MAAYTAIDDPSAYLKVHLYTGTGSSNAQTFADTDTDMQPDLVWIKTRGVSESHVVFDSVRTNGYYLKADATSAQIDGSSGGSNLWTSFDSDGFTVDSTGARTNTNTYTYAAWCWKGGTTSGKSTSGESITPSGYSINATSGVGIFAWSGTGSNGTITHGLGGDVGKGLMLVKQLNSTAGWQVYHQGTGATHTIYLNSSAVADDSNTVWNDTAPTSSVFTLGTNTGTNASGSTYVGYVFAPKQGFSKFGKYIGNGNADGPFVYTGFRPAWIMVRDIDNEASWMIMDNKRSGYNPTNNRLYAHIANAEESAVDRFDILSNGFKVRTGDADTNCSGCDLIYMAFAEQPFVNSEGVPCNAR